MLPQQRTLAKAVSWFVSEVNKLSGLVARDLSSLMVTKEVPHEKNLAAWGITTMEETNDYLRKRCLPAAVDAITSTPRRGCIVIPTVPWRFSTDTKDGAVTPGACPSNLSTPPCQASANIHCHAGSSLELKADTFMYCETGRFCSLPTDARSSTPAAW